jgi:molybdate transport system substrate-binding protein
VKIRSVLIANIGFLLLLFVNAAATAAELKLISAAATRTLMLELGPKFERASGHKLTITFTTAGEAVKRVQGGEVFDVALMPRPAINNFLKSGKAASQDVTDIARSGIGIAVRKGTARLDISSADGLKRTLLAARSISYANPEGGGAAGIHFAKVLERLGIADEMQSKTVFSKADETGVLIANGAADIGVNQIQTFISVEGIEVVGPLPGDLQDNVVFSAAIMVGASNAEASRALVDFLRTTESASVIKSKGMEPANP